MGIDIIIAGMVQCVFIFCKAFQQRNVAFMHYKLVLPTSVFMAFAEIFVIAVVAVNATTSSSYLQLIPLAISIGVGGGIGALSAMWLHYRFVKGG